MIFWTPDQTYQVEFRHRTKFGKHPELYAKSPVNAVTVCAISGYDQNGKQFIALGTSICVEPDNWWRKLGRRQSFDNALKTCRLLDPASDSLRDEFCRAFPFRPPATRQRSLMPNFERQVLIDAGETIRQERKSQREEGRLEGKKAAK